MRNPRFWMAVVLATVCLALPAAAQVSLTTLGTPYSQDFNTLANSGTTNNLTITGWYLTETGGGARDNEQYGADNGGSTTGDTYSYGTASTTERALGGLQSGTLIPVFGAAFTNNTGATITSLAIAYTGEQWRLGTSGRTVLDRINFQYSLDATGLANGTWTDVDPLDFVQPFVTGTTGARDGNAVENRTAVSSTVASLSIANGSTFWIRWTDFNASGADDGLSVDDFSLTPSGTEPTPTLSISDVTLNEGNSGTTLFTFQVTLSLGSATFDIATQDNTATEADNDYVSNSGNDIAITAGTPYEFTVTVNGDTTYESAETFFVNLSDAQPGTVVISKSQGVGTITNDDAMPAVEIFQIQGSGAASPYANLVATTTNNVVTGVGPEGFFIQTPQARDDGNPDTSNGIYVYTVGVAGLPTLAAGDLVDVTGKVVEYFNFTEFSGSLVVTKLPGTSPLPLAVELDASLPPTDPTDAWWTIGWERLEGMLVHVASGITTAPNQSFGGTTPDPTAEVFAVASPNRAFREEGIQYPGLAGLPVWDGNPEVFEIDADKLGAVANPDIIPAGSTYTATGAMGFEFSGWELWPTSFEFTPPTLPHAVRARHAGEFTVATYNMLRFGASEANWTVRLPKVAYYIRVVLGAPDVVGVEECMTIGDLTALATQIHTDDPTLTYTPYLIEGNDVGGIDVGYLVRSTVQVDNYYRLGQAETLSVDGSLLWDHPPLFLEARYIANGTPFPFTVVVNHTKMISTVYRDLMKRLEQADSLADKVQAYQVAHPTRPLVVVGDLNAYEFTDGYVDVVGQIAGVAVPADNQYSLPNVTNPPLTKQAFNAPAADRYSYIYGGSAQVLDHALTSSSTDQWVRGFQFGRGNSDVMESFLTDPSNYLHASDHDGAVLYLMSDSNGNGIPDDQEVLTCAAWVSEVGTWGPALAPCGDLTSTATTATYESASVNQVLTDFAYEVQFVATRPKQPTAANTLFVRGAPTPRGASLAWNSGYAFSIAMNGKYSIFRYSAGKPVVVQAWVTPTPQVINGSGLPNTLTVVASGGTLTFSINGTPVKTITGQTLLSGKVGLGMVRSMPTTPAGPNDTFVINTAKVSPGASSVPLRPVSGAQERANEAANRAAMFTRPDPLFAGGAGK
jgi:uncharacterized protein